MPKIDAVYLYRASIDFARDLEYKDLKDCVHTKHFWKYLACEINTYFEKQDKLKCES